MSLKTKLTSLITTFVLLCSLLTVGVFAVKNTTFNVGGNIEFNVQGIEADIELTANGVQNAEFNNDEEIGKDVLKKIEIRNNTSADSIAQQFAKWSNLDMTFAEGQSTATIELKITNKASEEDNYIDITALADATTKDNARIKVANNAGGITALLKSGEDATFTITFSVIDDEYKASLNDFSVNFDMQKKVLADFLSYDADEALTFECDTSAKTATLTDGKNATGEVIVPAYVKKDSVICAVTAISSYSFEGSELTNITFPNTLLTIGDGAFETCGNLKNAIIPDSVTSIGKAFNWSSITNITLSKNLTSIENNAFEMCSNLTSIEIPSSVTSIGNSAFMSCGNLTNVIILDGVTSIGSMAFYEGAFTSITIPSSITNIGDEAFSSCSNLTNIAISDGVTSIGDWAFSYCSSLISITIPDSVTSIGDGAFSGCGSLTNVYYTGTQADWNALLENIGSDNDDLLNAAINFNYTGA